VSFAATTLRVASQRVLLVYFVIDSVRKLLDTPSYMRSQQKLTYMKTLEFPITAKSYGEWRSGNSVSGTCSTRN
jgi:hypothetical protein